MQHSPDSLPHPRCLFSIRKQRSDGHRAYAAWDWGNCAGDLHGLVKGYVTSNTKMAVADRNPCRPYVDHHRTRLDPAPSHEAWLTHCDYKEGSGSCTRMPSISSRAFRVSIVSSTSRSLVSSVRLTTSVRKPASRARFCLPLT